jgi:hypothetical protein
VWAVTFALPAWARDFVRRVDDHPDVILTRAQA